MAHIRAHCLCCQLCLQPRHVPDREQPVFIMNTNDINALNVCMSNTRYLRTISDELEFSRQILVRIHNKLYDITQILPVAAQFSHADGRMDGQTDVTKLTDTFRSSFVKKKRKNSASTSQ